MSPQTAALAFPVVDLGERNSVLSGIWAPVSQSAPLGLTAQFTENAEDYADRYASSEYFKCLIQRGVALLDLQSDPGDILDIGAGAGDNSTFPCAELFNNAQIVATDLSPNLLLLLKKGAEQRKILDRTTIICVDAMENIFHPNSFDMVIGSAILHHLIEPMDALNAAHRVLRPGGVALFFEPFELGYSLICGIFDRIASEADLREYKMEQKTLDFFRMFANDVRRRLGRDKSAPLYREIDDKWLFSRAYFIEAAAKAGFSSVVIESIHAPEGQLRMLCESFLRLGASTNVGALPEWARAYVEQADELFVESAPDILSEGIIALKK